MNKYFVALVCLIVEVIFMMVGLVLIVLNSWGILGEITGALVGTIFLMLTMKRIGQWAIENREEA